MNFIPDTLRIAVVTVPTAARPGDLPAIGAFGPHRHSHQPGSHKGGAAAASLRSAGLRRALSPARCHRSAEYPPPLPSTRGGIRSADVWSTTPGVSRPVDSPDPTPQRVPHRARHGAPQHGDNGLRSAVVCQALVPLMQRKAASSTYPRHGPVERHEWGCRVTVFPRPRSTRHPHAADELRDTYIKVNSVAQAGCARHGRSRTPNGRGAGAPTPSCGWRAARRWTSGGFFRDGRRFRVMCVARGLGVTCRAMIQSDRPAGLSKLRSRPSIYDIQQPDASFSPSAYPTFAISDR